jgi:hypothetical protein
VPRIQRLTHTIQRIAYVNFFKPEPQDHRPHDVLTHDVEPVASSAAWRATSFSAFVPYGNPPTR